MPATVAVFPRALADYHGLGSHTSVLGVPCRSSLPSRLRHRNHCVVVHNSGWYNNPPACPKYSAGPSTLGYKPSQGLAHIFVSQLQTIRCRLPWGKRPSPFAVVLLGARGRSCGRASPCQGEGTRVHPGGTHHSVKPRNCSPEIPGCCGGAPCRGRVCDHI